MARSRVDGGRLPIRLHATFSIRHASFAALFLLCLSGVSKSWAQTVVTSVPGTRVSLAPPTGFVAADLFPGFQQPETGSSIVVTEIPGPFAAVRAGMTPERMTAQGVTLLSSESLRIANRDGVLMAASQAANGVAYRKWLSVFGDSHATVVIVATFPEASAAELAEPLKHAVSSAEWNPESPVGVFDGLSFRIEETASLKVARRLSNMLVLTRNGDAEPPIAPGEPLLLVGSSLGTAQVGDIEAFAKARLAQTADVTAIRDVRGEAVTIASSPGYELVAAARHASSGTELALYQLIVVRGQAYYVAQGMVGAESAEQGVADFRAVTRTLTFEP